ncbi:MAG: transposase [Bacteroidetes bacterium]|jgi:transposase-like protein|nr:transposase [Bacteroidota bacterium]
MTTRQSYTREFKREAVRLAEERGNRSATARDLGIHPSMTGTLEEATGARGR